MKNKDKQRNNVSGGSGGGGGYEYQAKAYALIAAKMIAKSPLTNWGDTGCSQIPVAISMELGDGGDDLRVDLKSGKQLDIQAKKNVRRGSELWDALLQIADKIASSPSIFGIFLTNPNASSTITDKLKNDIERIGQGRDDKIKDITQDFVRRLEAKGFDPVTICSRLRIVIRDLEPSSSGEEETLATLRPLLADQAQAILVSSQLFEDGMQLIRLRGRRDPSHVISFLLQAGIQFSKSTANLSIIRHKFLAWLAKTHQSIVIPSLQINLPLTKAWIKLRLMDSESTDDKPQNLEQQIEKYHEWHRLAENMRDVKVLPADAVIHSNQHTVIVGGPGSGKSTLLRRLTQILVENKELALRVSLRLVSRRISRGDTFNEAIISVAAQDYGVDTVHLQNLLQQANYLLADGLDEVDPNRENIAKNLFSWASANPERYVIVTTRPIGHNPAWFSGWRHYELLPLRDDDIEEYANTLFAAMNDIEDTDLRPKHFLEKLENSHTASLAARNPQLLGFLITLFFGGKPIDGSRYQLFEAMIGQIAQLTRPDREFQHHLNNTISYRTLDHLGWLLMNSPALEYKEIVHQVAERVAEEFSFAPFESGDIVEKAMQFWEERGLLEKVGTAYDTTITFVHFAFQEFTATRYLADLPKEEFIVWFEANRHATKYRELILLLGETSRLEIVISLLLNLDDPHDPVSVEAFLASDVLAEANDPPSELQQKVFEQLIPRLTSEIPLVAYEAGEKLKPLTAINPRFMGELGLQLTYHESYWVQEIGCALGIASGSKYVNLPVLLEVYPKATPYRSFGERRSIFTPQLAYELIFGLVVDGGKELIARGYSNIVEQKFGSGKGCSFRMKELLHEVLVAHLGQKELIQRHPDWYTIDDNLSEQMQRATEASNRAFFEAILNASNQMIDFDNGDYILPTPDLKIRTIRTIYGILDIANSAATDYAQLRGRVSEESVMEIVRLVMVACDVNPVQTKADTEYGLRLLENGERLLNLYDTSDDYIPIPELEWHKIIQSEQCLNLLSDTLEHPVGFIRRFAALFLVNCFEHKAVKKKFLYHLLKTKDTDAIKLYGFVLAEVWPEEVSEFILQRLETNLTDDCKILLPSLVKTLQDDQRSRIEAILRYWLRTEQLKAGDLVLDTIKELEMENLFEEDIREICFGWLKSSPKTQVNMESSFLKFLCRIQAISFDELFAFAKIKDNSVSKKIVNEICAFVVQGSASISTILNAVKNSTLPPTYLIRLSVVCPELCFTYQEFFIELATENNHPAQLESIRALGNGWADRSKVELVLRELTRSESEVVRNIATRQLRQIAMSTK